MLEVAWTVVPIFILIVIAIPSFKLLSLQYTYPAPQLTIKATGNAWNWTHEYPDLGGVTVNSVMLTDRDVLEAKFGADELKKRYAGLTDLEVTRRMKADASPIWYERKQPRMLAVDNEIVVPVNKVVHVLVTASDVIHSWTVQPSAPTPTQCRAASRPLGSKLARQACSTASARSFAARTTRPCRSPSGSYRIRSWPTGRLR